MIVCENCGAAEEDAMDVRQTIYAKHDHIINHRCKRCGSYELVMLDFMGKYVMILEEADEFPDERA